MPRTEGHWILGLIEDGCEDFRIVLCPNNQRGEADLLPAIIKHVKRGTTIRTDCWKAYGNLSSHGFIHEVVNHSAKVNPFVSATGVHTNRIESSWRPLKDNFRSVRIRSICEECQTKLNDVEAEWRNAEESEKAEARKQANKTAKKIRAEMVNCAACGEYQEKFAEKLVEYQWRRENRKEIEDPFEKLLNAIRRLYPC